MSWTIDAVVIFGKRLCQGLCLIAFRLRQLDSWGMRTEPIACPNQGFLHSFTVCTFKGVEQGGEEFLEKSGCLVICLAGEDIDGFTLVECQPTDHHILDHPGIRIISPEMDGVSAIAIGWVDRGGVG